MRRYVKPLREASGGLLQQYFATPCTYTILSNDIGFDAWSQTTLAHFTARVDRPFDEAAQIMDPQNWGCNSFFRSAYVAQSGVAGYTIDATTKNAVEKLQASAPGSAWNDVLFEHFEMTFAWFRNFLDVETQRQGNDWFRHAYALNKAALGSIVGVERTDGIDRDAGFCVVKNTPTGEVYVEGLKVIRFSNWGLLTPTVNAWVQVFLRAMADEAIRTICQCPVP